MDAEVDGLRKFVKVCFINTLGYEVVFCFITNMPEIPLLTPKVCGQNDNFCWNKLYKVYKVILFYKERLLQICNMLFAE